MSVVPITVFFSLLLAACFVVLFVRERSRQFSSAERDSLLPLAEETPRPVPAHGGARTSARHPDGGADDQCGCVAGARPPCAGCRRRAAPSAHS